MRYRLEFFHPCSLVWPFVLLFCYHATDVCLPAVDKCILPSKFPSAFLLSHVTRSVEGRLAVAMQQSEQDIRDLLTQLWNREQLVATFNNLSQSMEETATPKTHTVLCSCSSSGQDSSRSTPDYYESSEGSPSNGRDIEGTREQHLHYPPNALLDPGNVNLISDKSMACLDQFIEHCQKVIGPGYEEALEKTFVDNADALSRCRASQSMGSGFGAGKMDMVQSCVHSEKGHGMKLCARKPKESCEQEIWCAYTSWQQRARGILRAYTSPLDLIFAAH